VPVVSHDGAATVGWRRLNGARSRQRSCGRGCGWSSGGSTVASVAPPVKDVLASPLKDTLPKNDSDAASPAVAGRGVPSADNLGGTFTGVLIGRPTVAANPLGLDENTETFSLNLFCYRLGQGCESHQIRVAR
jgi:hypothetical protein